MRVEIVGVGKNICGECDGRRESCEIGARRRHAAKTGIKVFGLQRHMLPDLVLGAEARGPAGRGLVHATVVVLPANLDSQGLVF